MPRFIRNFAIAMTWTAEECRILKVAKNGDKVSVVKAWHGRIEKEHPLSEVIVHGLKQVDMDDDIFVVAGGDDTGWGIADIELPLLNATELRNALAFELRKEIPMPLEKFQWGYRVLSQDQKTKKSLMRVVYVRKECWSKWLSTCRPLHHIDVICPPQATLLPLFDKDTIIFPDKTRARGFAYSSENGRQITVPVACAAETSLTKLLPQNTFILNRDITDLPQTEQIEWLPTLLLAAYALTAEAGKDCSTMIPVPEKQRAHRNTFMKGLAACLITFIIIVTVVGITKHVQAIGDKLDYVEQEITNTRKNLEELQKLNQPTERDYLKALQQEFAENSVNIPPLGEALAELSRIIEPPAWISQRFEWNAGFISIQVQSTGRDMDLVTRLENSECFGDVREQSSSAKQDIYTTKITMNARYDTEEEKQALLARQAKMKKLERMGKNSAGSASPDDDTKTNAASKDEAEEQNNADSPDAESDAEDSENEEPSPDETLDAPPED